MPRTWSRDGPMGEGMVQLWQEQDRAQRAVHLVASDRLPATGWRSVIEGHRHGVAHWLAFHRDPKLRTVLWGWLGDALTAEELDGIECVGEGLHSELRRCLRDLLSPEEVAALAARCAELRAEGQFPAPNGAMPASSVVPDVEPEHFWRAHRVTHPR